MSTASQPEVSVLVITYNQGRFVRQALDGVVMQMTNFDVEVVLADDCSQDSTLEILKEYEANYPHVRLLPSEQRLGITLNYKRGFDACRGRYVAILEGDDYWTSPRRLEILSAFLQQHPECSFCFNRIIRLDEAASSVLVHPAFGPEIESRFFTASRLARGNFVGNLSACMYRRDVIAGLEPGFWNLELYEWPFNIVVARQGLIGYVPEILSVYRAHPGGIWSQKTPVEQGAQMLELIEMYNKYLEFEFDAEFQYISRVHKADVMPSPLRRLGRRMKPFVPPALVTLANGITGRGRR